MSTVVEHSVDEADPIQVRPLWLDEPDLDVEAESLRQRVSARVGESREGILGSAAACSEMGDGVIWVGADETILTFNDAAVRFFGPFVDQERISEWVNRLGFSEPAEAGRGSGGSGFPFRECLAQRTSIVRDLCCRSWWERDVRWFRVACIFDSKKEGSHQVLIVLRDLSELRRIKSLVGKLQLVEAQNPSPTLQATADGVICHANQAARNLLEDLPDSNRVFSLMPDICQQDLAECIRDGGKLTNEFELKDRVFQFVAVGMPDFGWANVYGSDITSHRRTEAQLRESKGRAEAATRMKSEFLANMSHEIRTPLNGILGMASFLVNSNLDDRQREFADTIQSSGESLLAIINDILDFSKLEAQRLHLENVEFELSRVVGDTMDLLARQGQSKGLEVLVDFGVDVPQRLVGDPVRLRQILNNLIGNAIKFTEQGEVVLSVSCLGTSGSGIELQFAVSDSGIGISEEKIEKLFRPFSQAESSTTRKYGGTGLGLVISKTLVELMGGKMKVESTLGAGSEFCFSARFGCGPNGGRQKQEQHVLKGHRVLVVDGHGGSRKILGRLLKHWGLVSTEVGEFNDGLMELTRAYQGGRAFEVILLDVRDLPSCENGGLQSIRNAAGNSDPKVILLGGVDDSLTKIRRDHQIGEELLCKPIKPNRLFESLTLHLNCVVAEPNPDRECRVGDEALAGEIAALRILLVEDNEVNVMVATEQLRRLGVTADCASNGAEALKKIERQSYDVVLMDCQMPVLDGFQATSEIRSREREKGIETGNGLFIIAMTANAMEGDREKCLASGMDEYLSKPVRLDRLREMLESILPRLTRDADGAPASEKEFSSESREIEELVSEVGVDLARDILGAFVKDSRVAVDALRKGIEERDAETILRRAHTLKGTSATCGSRSIVYTCLQIETLTKEGEFSELPGLVDELSQELEAAFGRIESFQATNALASSRLL